jgi:CubicO group peptidase (beta-lactamase class C family)
VIRSEDRLMDLLHAKERDDLDGPSHGTPPRCGLIRRQALGLLAGGLAAGLIRPSDALAAPSPTWPGSSWTSITPATAGFDPTKFTQAVNYAKSKGGSGFVARYGYQVATWGTATQKYDIKSATKGVGSLLVSLALQDGLVQLADPVLKWLTQAEFAQPASNATAGPGWLQAITLQHLLDHMAGFDEGGGFVPLLFAPGAYYLYSNGGANWLADVLTVRFKADLLSVLKQRIATPIGIAGTELTWRANKYRPTTLRGLARREFGAGLYITARAFARIGLLLLRNGQWRGTQLVSSSYLSQAEHSRPELANVLDFNTKQPSDLRHYNMYFENNDDGSYPNLPPDVFFFWGKYNNHVFVVPSLDLVVVRIGTVAFNDSFGSVNTLLGNFVKAVVPTTSALTTLVRRAETPEDKLTPAQRRHLRQRGPVDNAE